MYKRILVPIDGSETALRGLGEAIKLAQDQHAAIRLVHIVNEVVLLSADAFGTNIAALLDTQRKDGESLLAQAETAARGAGLDVSAKLIEVLGGHAGESIVQQANQWSADLIVCGTHGRRGLRRIVLGSDAEFVVRHTPCPVLLVRRRQPFED